MKLIKKFEHFKGSLFPHQFSPPDHIPHLKERFLKELNLEDFHDIIYNIKDEFNMEFMSNAESNTNSYYSFYWDEEFSKIVIYFVFLSEFYRDNKDNIHEHLEEFEDRLSDFEFDSGVTTSIGSNTKAYVYRWKKDDFPEINNLCLVKNGSGHYTNSKYISCFYYIEARLKV